MGVGGTKAVLVGNAPLVGGMTAVLLGTAIVAGIFVGGFVGAIKVICAG